MKDAVNNPSHYGGDVWWEHVKIVEARRWDYLVGNATKYLWRMGKKTADPTEDLEKAMWYLRRRRDNLVELQSRGSWLVRLHDSIVRRYRRGRLLRAGPSAFAVLAEIRVPPAINEAITAVWRSGSIPCIDEIARLNQALSLIRGEVLSAKIAAMRRAGTAASEVAAQRAQAAAQPASAPEPSPPSGGFPSAAAEPLRVPPVGVPDDVAASRLSPLLGLNVVLATEVIYAMRRHRDSIDDAIASVLRENAARISEEYAREMILMAHRVVRWLPDGTPYRIDVDPEDTTRVG